MINICRTIFVNFVFILILTTSVNCAPRSFNKNLISEIQTTPTNNSDRNSYKITFESIQAKDTEQNKYTFKKERSFFRILFHFNVTKEGLSPLYTDPSKNSDTLNHLQVGNIETLLLDEYSAERPLRFIPLTYSELQEFLKKSSPDSKIILANVTFEKNGKTVSEILPLITNSSKEINLFAENSEAEWQDFQLRLDAFSKAQSEVNSCHELTVQQYKNTTNTLCSFKKSLWAATINFFSRRKLLPENSVNSDSLKKAINLSRSLQTQDIPATNNDRGEIGDLLSEIAFKTGSFVNEEQLFPFLGYNLESQVKIKGNQLIPNLKDILEAAKHPIVNQKFMVYQQSLNMDTEYYIFQMLGKELLKPWQKNKSNANFSIIIGFSALTNSNKQYLQAELSVKRQDSFSAPVANFKDRFYAVEDYFMADMTCREREFSKRPDSSHRIGRTLYLHTVSQYRTKEEWINDFIEHFSYVNTEGPKHAKYIYPELTYDPEQIAFLKKQLEIFWIARRGNN